MKVIRLEGKLYLRKQIPKPVRSTACGMCAFQGKGECSISKCSTDTKEFIFVEVQEVPKHAQV